MKKILAILLLAITVFVFYRCNESSIPVDNGTKNYESTKLSKRGDVDNAAILAKMKEINKLLAAKGLSIAVEEIDFFTIGVGRPSVRLHQEPFRWVPNDPRRNADGDNITYMIDLAKGTTTSGLTSAQTEAAIDRALTTWNDDKPLKKVNIIKRPYSGGDITIYDFFFGFGGLGDYLAADIVDAGWYPRAFFDAIGGPGGGHSILAFSISFIWVDGDGNPSDINGDNYIDQALNEVYYNDTFGDPGDDRANNPWGIEQDLPGVDVETIALHENGHSLDLGHFGPPPVALMNPIYGGIMHSPLPPDNAGMNAVWGSWPNP